MKVVITGGSKGIGKAIALAFAEAGASVAICARGQEALNQAGSEIEACRPGGKHLIFQADCGQKDQLQAFFEQARLQFGSVDVLVNNAGLYQPEDLLEGTGELLDEMLKVNLLAAYHGARYFAGDMKSRKSGHIFNICSVASLRAVPHGGAYTVSKHAILGLSRALRLELKPFGVKVTAVIPGSTETASWEGTPADTSKFVRASDVASAVLGAWRLSPNSTVEELIIAPTTI